MKILIFTAIQGRREITELFMIGVKRLQQYSGHEVDLFCVCSDFDDETFLKSKGVEYCVYPNAPLSDKFEFGFKEALKKEFDYMLRMGSDDLLDHDIFPKYYNILMSSGTPFFGLKEIGLMNIDNLECCVYKYYTHRTDLILGAGSMLSKDLCMKFENQPLYGKRPLNRGLDNASEQEIKKYAKPVVVKTSSPMLIDVKSSVNIWPYSIVSKRMPKVDFKELTHFTSKQEDAMLRNNQKFTCVAVIPVKGRLPLLRYTITRLYQKNGIKKVICIGDSEQEQWLCESLGADFIYHDNKPLGKKWNAGFLKAKEYDPDCCLFVGSSDWISDNWLYYTSEYLTGYDMIGKPDFNLVDYGKQIRVCHWPGYTDPRRVNEPIGIGRVLSRRILERLNWQPMEDKLDSSLDWSMFQRVKQNGGKVCLLKTDDIQSLSLSTSVWENKHKFEDHWTNKLPSKRLESSFLEQWFPEVFEL